MTSPYCDVILLFCGGLTPNTSPIYARVCDKYGGRCEVPYSFNDEATYRMQSQQITLVFSQSKAFTLPNPGSVTRVTWSGLQSPGFGESDQMANRQDESVRYNFLCDFFLNTHISSSFSILIHVRYSLDIFMTLLLIRITTEMHKHLICQMHMYATQLTTKEAVFASKYKIHPPDTPMYVDCYLNITTLEKKKGWKD